MTKMLKFLLKVTVLDAIHLVSNAWKLVSSEIIKNCFKSAFRGQKPSDLYKDLKLANGFTSQLNLMKHNLTWIVEMVMKVMRTKMT